MGTGRLGSCLGRGRRIRCRNAPDGGAGRWQPCPCRRALARLPLVLRCAGFDWFPGGHRLVVSGVGKGNTRVLRVDARTGRTLDVTPVGRRGALYRDPHVSPTGRLISYVEERGVPGTASCCELRLVVAASDGRGVRMLFRPDHFKDTPLASWAPDGSRLAFTTEQRSLRDPFLGLIDYPSGTIHRLDPSGGAHLVRISSGLPTADGSRLGRRPA